MQSIATLLWQWVITWKVSHQQGTATCQSATQCIVSQCAVLCWCVLQCVAVCCSVPNRCGFRCGTIPAPVSKIWNNRQLVYSDLDRGRLAAACCMCAADVCVWLVAMRLRCCESEETAWWACKWRGVGAKHHKNQPGADPPKNREIALWLNTRVVKCKYYVSQEQKWLVQHFTHFYIIHG